MIHTHRGAMGCGMFVSQTRHQEACSGPVEVGVRRAGRLIQGQLLGLGADPQEEAGAHAAGADQPSHSGEYAKVYKPPSYRRR